METNIEQLRLTIRRKCLQRNLLRSRRMLTSVRHGIAAYNEVDSGWVISLRQWRTTCLH